MPFEPSMVEDVPWRILNKSKKTNALVLSSKLANDKHTLLIGQNTHKRLPGTQPSQSVIANPVQSNRKRKA